jgi:holo-[acyl-carrier protein] synthase
MMPTPAPFSAFRIRQRRRTAARPSVCCDLAFIPAVSASMQQFGDRYLHRIFTPAEIQDARPGSSGFAASLAARFAAKEACFKLLNPDADTALPWKQVEVVRPRGRAPFIRLHQDLRHIAARARDLPYYSQPQPRSGLRNRGCQRWLTFLKTDNNHFSKKGNNDEQRYDPSDSERPRQIHRRCRHTV